MVAAIRNDEGIEGLARRVFIRPKDVIESYSLSEGVVYGALNAGQLKAFKFRGRIWLIEPKDVEQWIARESSVAE